MIPLLLALAQAAEPAGPAFGADFAAGYLAGSLRNDWTRPGLEGAWMARYDAFIVPRTQPGPRLGASLWGGASLWPIQKADENGEGIEIHNAEMGVLSILRFDPAAPTSGGFGFGFSRFDIEPYYDAPFTLPALTFEGLLRRRLREPTFVDLVGRVSWAQSADGRGDLTDWWLLQGGLMVGGHVK